MLPRSKKQCCYCITMHKSTSIDTTRKGGSRFTQLKSFIKDADEERYIVELKKALNGDFNVDQTDEYGNTLLHYASRERKYSIIDYLLSMNADPNIINDDGRLPIHMAAIYCSRRDIGNLIGAVSVIDRAIDDSNRIFSRLLLRSPSSIRVEDDHDNTPLDYYSLHSDLSDIPVLTNLINMLDISHGLTDHIMYKIEIYLLLRSSSRRYMINKN